MDNPEKNLKQSYEPAGRERAGLAARIAAANLVSKVIDGRQNLDLLCDEQSGLASWRSLIAKDRALARAIALTALRHRRRIAAAISSLVRNEPPKNARHLLHMLHAAAAQILFMQVPDSAAVNLAVTAISEDRRSARFAGFANALLRRMANEKTAIAAAPVNAAGLFPGWLAGALAADHGALQADAIAQMVALEPKLDLTLHPRLGGPETDRLLREIGGFRLPTGSIRIADGRPVREIPGYAEGNWWVQDAAASLPARLLGDVGGLDVADLCAAPGGKTAQLAAAGARVIAVDVSDTRLERLRQNLARLSLSAEIFKADILVVSPPRRFDAVLLDAPCSSTGTMRRHPDVMWTKTPADVETLAILQERMIHAAVKWVKPGGMLVFANCSLLKREGEALIDRILGAIPALSLVPVLPGEADIGAALIGPRGELRTLPSSLALEPKEHGGMDGFFACRFKAAS